jgi:hypothetical protein
VPLVAYKTMVVRAYPFVRRGLLVPDTLTGQRVTGELTLSIDNRDIYKTGPTRVDGARLGSTSHLDCGSWDRELTLAGGGRCGCGCDGGTVSPEREPWLDFQEVIEWPGDDVASIEFHRGEDAFHALVVGDGRYPAVRSAATTPADLPRRSRV